MFWGFLKEVIFLFNEMAIYLLLGFTFAGFLRLFFNDKFINRHLGESSFKANFFASIFGVPLPLCSCGVLPTGISLLNRGASRGATISFLTSTPQTGIDSIFVTYGFLGLPLALFKVISALITGIVGGTVFNIFSRDSIVTTLNNKDSTKKLNSLKDFIIYSYIELVQSLSKWLLIGIILAAVISYFLPDNILHVTGIDNKSWLLYLITIAISVPMYVCATASVPIAAALILKGFPLGAAIIFLMAGPATNIATLTVLWKTLGKKATIIYLFNIIIGSVLFAALFDYLFAGYQIIDTTMIHNHHTFSIIKYLGSITLVVLLMYPSIRSLWKRSSKNGNSKSFMIEGITCSGCVTGITRRLYELPFVKDVDLNIKGDCTVYFKQDEQFSLISDTILKAGYKLKEEKADFPNKKND